MKRFKLLIGFFTVAFLIVVYKGTDPVVLLIPSRASPSIFGQCCQYLEDLLFGEEYATESSDKLELKGLVLLFRHGERSPLFPDAPELTPDCSAYHNVDRKSFEEYVDLVNSRDFRRFVSADKVFDGFKWHPDRAKCISGNMTAEGALQMVRLANYLRQRYQQTQLFKNNVSVAISSSSFYRTFQSAVAFSSGFLYPDSDAVGPIHIENADDSVHFCRDRMCTCPTIDKILAEEYLQKHSIVRDGMATLAKLMGMAETTNPVLFVDFVLGKYACRRIPLPCFTANTCLTVDKFTDAHNVIYKLFSEAYANSKSVKTLFAAQSRPILEAITSITRHFREPGNSNTTQIKLFSGHDISLMPLLFSLGINVTVFPPPYASRMTFEVYQLKDISVIKDSVYIRVLYNGIDYTSSLEFCKVLHYGLCPARHFETFSKSSLFYQITKTQELSQIC